MHVEIHSSAATAFFHPYTFFKELWVKYMEVILFFKQISLGSELGSP